MEIQNPLELIYKQSHPIQTFQLKDFYDYIHTNNPLIMSRKYFTQLDLISDYTLILSQFFLSVLGKERHFQLQTKKQQVDEECHLLLINLTVNDIGHTWKVLIIQMDKIIKVNIKHFDQQTNQFITQDSFWFDHSTYLNQKISNTYKLISLKQMDTKAVNTKEKINCILIARILQSLARKAPEIQVKANKISEEQNIQSKHMKIITHFDNLKFFNSCKFPLLGQRFYESLGGSQNFLKICSYLSIRQIVRLRLLSGFIKMYLIDQQNVFFKELYEYNYGKTGFDINEMNWRKLLDKKRGEKCKKKSNSSLMVNQGIFRTH